MQTKGDRSWLGWLACLIGLLLLIVLLLLAGRDKVTGPGDGTAGAAKTDRPALPATREPPPPLHHTSSGKFEAKWLDPEGQKESRVRKLLKFEATPSLVEEANKATATVKIRVEEWGEIWDSGKAAWVEMTAAQFGAWRQGAHDSHSATATLVKTTGNGKDEPGIERQDATGDGSKAPHKGYNETESGINITTAWQGDALQVKWTGSGSEEGKERIEIPFSSRFRSPAATGGELPAK